MKHIIITIIEEQAKVINLLQNENKKYKKTLKFYADKKNYKRYISSVDAVFNATYSYKIIEDNGEKARKTIEETGK